jgi:hypothetical protein
MEILMFNTPRILDSELAFCVLKCECYPTYNVQNAHPSEEVLERVSL